MFCSEFQFLLAKNLSVRSKSAVEGNVEDSSAPELEVPHQSEARCGINSAPCLFIQNRAEQKNYLFLLKEIFWRLWYRNCKGNFSVRRAVSCGAVAERSG
jgi:hypothetical protein